jgi:hypothetical protein
MCTVLLRFAPGEAWPLLLAAVRDEFVDRAWDPPGTHWGDGVWGGRDRSAGGTWLAVDPDAPGVAAVLNGVRLPPPAAGRRPTRGTLPLDALRGRAPHGGDRDGFHLLAGTPEGVRLWSWDGTDMLERSLPPGDHIVVNRGTGLTDEPVVAHFLPLLRSAAGPPAARDADEVDALSTVDFWGDWARLLGGDGLGPADPRALLVRRTFDGMTYGSTSASLVAVGPGRVRYDFSGSPADPAAWRRILPER